MQYAIERPPVFCLESAHGHPIITMAMSSERVRAAWCSPGLDENEQQLQPLQDQAHSDEQARGTMLLTRGVSHPKSETRTKGNINKQCALGVPNRGENIPTVRK